MKKTEANTVLINTGLKDRIAAAVKKLFSRGNTSPVDFEMNPAIAAWLYGQIYENCPAAS